jgi:cytochrome c biogenesis protein CcdA
MLNVLTLFGRPTIMAEIAASIAILFGILNIKEYFFPNLPFKIRMPLKVRQLAGEWAHKATIPSAIILGVLVGITEFPCSGAVYIAILGYLHAKESFVSGILYLALYNLVFVAPLIAIFIAASNQIITEKMINWQEQMGRKMHLLLAAVMIALGVLIFYLT